MEQTAANSLHCVIFDLDGVIFDSQEANVAFYNHLLERVGRPPTADRAREVIHREDMLTSLRHLIDDPVLVEQAVAYWKEMDNTPFLEMLTLFPGVRSTLDSLKRRTRLAVATNRTYTTRPALDRFGLLEMFDLVVTPLEAGVTKPDPRMMEMILGELGAGTQSVAFVGDSIVDQRLCQASGVRLIAFRNPELEAWAHADSFAAIPGLLGLGHGHGD